MPTNVFNPDLLQLARERSKMNKSAFTPPDAVAAGGDPAAMGGGAPPMDPTAMGGGMPPMDPAAMGGAPPAPSGVTEDQVRQIVQQAVGAAGGGGKGAGPVKPKIDVPTEIYQIKKILVMMAQEMGLSIPPTLLLGDPAQDPSIPPEQAAQDPLSSAATQSGGGVGPIQPPAPMNLGPQPGGAEKAARAIQLGSAFSSEKSATPVKTGIDETTSKAQALAHRYRASMNR